jgi:hypothetical protein
MRHLYKTTSVSSIWPRQRGKQLIVFLVATILVIAAQAQTPPGTGVAGARVYLRHTQTA